MGKVFLSYAREDAGSARQIAQALEAAGNSVWWDQQIAGGDQFAQAIEEALEGADAVVVLWTETSCHSAWVRDEAAAGRDSNRLIPVCLNGCQPPLGFRQYQAIDLSAWNGRANSKALDPLKQAVAAKCGEPGRGSAVPVNRASVGAAPKGPLGPRALAAAAAVLLIAAAGLLLPRLGLFGNEGKLTPRVALGQFQVVSPDLDKAMSRAMHDEIMAAFGAENAVAVTAAAGLTGGRAAPFVLDGSIRKEGDALRLTVTLNDARSGTALWTRAFDRAAADSLATRQVAVAASQVVRCGLWGASAYPRRMSDDALALYLQLCNEQWGGSPEDQRIFEAARRVTTALPDFSFGWSALALAAVPLSHGSSADAATIRRQGQDAARRASQLDDDNPEGYMAEAGLLPTNRFADREALLKKAISVRPTECGCERTAYGDFLTSVGRIDEAVEQYQRAQAIMPLSPAVSLRLAHALYVGGREEEAERITDDMLKIWPDAVGLRHVQLKSALWTKRYDEALEMLEEPGLHLTRGQIDGLRATFTALRSNEPAAKAAAAAMVQEMTQSPRGNDRLSVAALAALGAEAAAIDAARRLIGARGHPLADVLFEPNLAAASANARYSALVGKLGLTDYWRSTRSLPDICRRQAKPPFCNVS